MSAYLSFYFNKNDPNFKSEEIIVDSKPGSYISHAFISAYIYDNFGVKIGYKVSDDYVQQVDENKYIVRINSTYYIENQGTITWQYSFINDVPSYYYPIGILAASNIVSTTGNYFGKTGVVSLMPNEDGTRNINIIFNF
jgi:hypothetical protein